MARQEQLKAEIVSLETWLEECDPENEECPSEVVKEVTNSEPGHLDPRLHL